MTDSNLEVELKEYDIHHEGVKNLLLEKQIEIYHQWKSDCYFFRREYSKESYGLIALGVVGTAFGAVMSTVEAGGGAVAVPSLLLSTFGLYNLPNARRTIKKYNNLIERNNKEILTAETKAAKRAKKRSRVKV
ncbi:MAG: hypothetical protein AABW84_01240 [Nanoarchaeota archaeon]